MAAGDAERRTADLHVRPLDEPFVDGVAQIHVGKAVRSHIADGRDPGFERHLCVARADQRALGNAGGELMVGIEVVLHGEVRVDIDHAGQQRGVSEINDFVARLRLHLCGRLDRDDAIAGDDEGLRIQQLACADIHQMRGTH